jgi:hypothetical protein
MPNWNAEAQRAVAHIEAELSEAHRGAFLWHEPSGVVLVFNNGLYEDPIPAKQMEFLKQALGLKGGTIHAVAHSSDRIIWAMMVTGVDPEWAFDCVWAAWHSACSQVDPGTYEPLDVRAFVERGDLPLEIAGKYQYGVAKKTIEAHYSDPRHWKSCRPKGWTFEDMDEEAEPE